MKHLLIVATFLTPFFAKAQSPDQYSKPQPFIEVTGLAEKEVVPDEIYINIILKDRYENKEKVTIDTQEKNLINALKAIGIDLKNLSLSDANADYLRYRGKKTDVFTKKEFILKVSDAATVNKVFDELDKLEIQDANIGKVSHSKIEELRKEVKIAAIKSAKEKATYLLEAIGEKPGKPLSITETDFPETYPVANYAVNYKMRDVAQAADMAPEMEHVEFKKIKIQYSIYAKFLIN